MMEKNNSTKIKYYKIKLKTISNRIEIFVE